MSVAVQTMFATIARGYDRANAVLSLGIDRGWRRRAIRLLAPRPGERILDACCGTGDVALALAPAVLPGGSVVGADFCEPMLERARAKRAARGGDPVARAVTFIAADALALPFADGELDGAIVAFGVRNLDDPVRGLRELARVVRPGGRVVVLEFGQPRAALFGPAFRWYASAVMPALGALVTGERAPYEYLPRTSAAFPSGEAFVRLMTAAGLGQSRAEPLTLGVAWAYRGEVGAIEGGVPC